MPIVFTIDSELASAQKLGYETCCYIDDYVNAYDNDVIIRWGNSSKVYDSTGSYREFRNIINPSSAICLNCTKPVALRKMSRVVNTPAIYKVRVPKNKLVVLRPTTHTGGNGFKVVKGPLELRIGREYATDFIPTKTEFRVWFIGNKTLCAKRVAGKYNEVTEYPCRSNWGYSFCDVHPILHRDTILAAKAIGLDVGAADVLYRKGKFYFLELNSAPTIDDRKILKFFTSNFDKFIKGKYE